MAAVGANARRRSAWLRTRKITPEVCATRKGEVPDGEQHGTCEHQETRVAEGELDAST